MIRYDLTDVRLKIEGIYGFEEHRRFRRYPADIIERYPRLDVVDTRCAGARLRFRTDSPKIRVELRVSNQFVDRGMSFYQANAAYAYVGAYDAARYVSLLSANEPYKDEIIAASFRNDGMNDVTVYFPQNPTIEEVCVYLEAGAALEPPTPHRVKLPFVFYGSSITQQGHTASPIAYPSLLSRFFDADLYNFGASGNAQGEPELAAHLGGIKKTLFFYDYDHNAPTLEHLRKTHEEFFRIFRAGDPQTPVIMTSRPANDTPDMAERAATVRETYENARRGGDRNVYFVDGRTLFGDADPALCTTDCTHPNDLGHYKMAKTLEALIRKERLLEQD